MHAGVDTRGKGFFSLFDAHVAPLLLFMAKEADNVVFVWGCNGRGANLTAVLLQLSIKRGICIHPLVEVSAVLFSDNCAP